MAFLIAQTLQTSHFKVLGAQTTAFSSKFSYGASESSDRYEAWKERVKIRPDWRDGWIMAGRLAFESHRFDEALIAVNHALLLDPNHEESKKLLNEILDARARQKYK